MSKIDDKLLIENAKNKTYYIVIFDDFGELILMESKENAK